MNHLKGPGYEESPPPPAVGESDTAWEQVDTSPQRPPRFCRHCGRPLVEGNCPIHSESRSVVGVSRRRSGRYSAQEARQGRRRLPVRQLPILLLGLIAIALAVMSGVLAGQITALRSNLSAASSRNTRDKADLEQQIGQLSNSLSGIASRLSGVETTLKSQPDPAAITKTVEASLFVIEDAAGSGSGFAVSSSSGHTRVLTNFHVVATAEGSSTYFKHVQVVQHAETFAGTVVKIDQPGDLALIDVAAVFPQLPVDKSVPAAGDTVYAFGAPLGQQLEDTVTQGVVSGLRLIQGLDRLQFSAQINPGNSGGPVVDSAGKVVGIAELSITSAQGLFFAVPMARACQTVVGC